MNRADISRAAGRVVGNLLHLHDDAAMAAFIGAASQWHALGDVPTEWRDKIVQAHAELALIEIEKEKLEKEMLDDFTTVDMLNSMSAAIMSGVKKEDYHKPLTPLQSEDWDELEFEIEAMLADGITPELADDWGDSLQVPSPMPRPQPGLPPSAPESAPTPLNNPER